MLARDIPGVKPGAGPVKRLKRLADLCWRNSDYAYSRRELMAELQSHPVAPDIVQCPNELINSIHCECRHFDFAPWFARLPFVTSQMGHPVLDIARTVTVHRGSRSRAASVSLPAA